MAIFNFQKNYLKKKLKNIEENKNYCICEIVCYTVYREILLLQYFSISPYLKFKCLLLSLLIVFKKSKYGREIKTKKCEKYIMEYTKNKFL